MLFTRFFNTYYQYFSPHINGNIQNELKSKCLRKRDLNIPKFRAKNFFGTV